MKAGLDDCDICEVECNELRTPEGEDWLLDMLDSLPQVPSANESSFGLGCDLKTLENACVEMEADFGS